MRTCRVCGLNEVQSPFYPEGTQSRKSAGNCCRACWNDKAKLWRDDPAKYEAWKNTNHKRSTMRSFGMTSDEYDYLYTDPVCAGCGVKRSSMHGSDKNARLVVDHNHETGKVRGLLCHDCNRTIATAHDDPEILRGLATYLEETA